MLPFWVNLGNDLGSFYLSFPISKTGGTHSSYLFQEQNELKSIQHLQQ